MKLPKKRILILLTALALSFAAVFGYAVSKHTGWNHRFKRYFVEATTRAFGVRIELKSLRGDLLRRLEIRGVKAWTGKTGGDQEIFSAESITFEYPLLSIFFERFSGWVDVTLDHPHFYPEAPLSGQSGAASGNPSVKFLSTLIRRLQKNAQVTLRDGVIDLSRTAGVRVGVEGLIRSRSFDLSFAMNHLKMGRYDMTSLWRVNGTLDEGGRADSPAITGTLETRGTVVNWKPLPSEGRLSFRLTPEKIEFRDSTVLGGIGLSGGVQIAGEPELDVLLRFTGYPADKIHDIFSFSSGNPPAGSISGEVRIKGKWNEPRLQGDLILEDRILTRRFQNIQLHFEGLYPEVRVSESRMMMIDGTSMRFSEKQVLLRELFQSETYEQLIKEEGQSRVAWKDWTLERREDDDSIELKKKLSGNVSFQYENTAQDETKPTDTQTTEHAVGLEYALTGSDNITVEVKEDESFVGLEKKSVF